MAFCEILNKEVDEQLVDAIEVETGRLVKASRRALSDFSAQYRLATDEEIEQLKMGAEDVGEDTEEEIDEEEEIEDKDEDEEDDEDVDVEDEKVEEIGEEDDGNDEGKEPETIPPSEPPVDPSAPSN